MRLIFVSILLLIISISCSEDKELKSSLIIENLLLKDSLSKLNQFIENQSFAVVAFVPENNKLKEGDSALVYVDIIYNGPFLRKDVGANIVKTEDSAINLFDDVIKRGDKSGLILSPQENDLDKGIRYMLYNLKRGSNFFSGVIEIEDVMHREKYLPFSSEIIVK